MKTGISILLAVALLLSMTACAGTPASTTEALAPATESTSEVTTAPETTATTVPEENVAETAETEATDDGASITTNGGATILLSSLEHQTEATDAPVVYYISDISPEALMAAYTALGWTPTGNVAVKLSTGEPPASNYLDPNLIKDVVQFVDGTIVECNTAYGGSRASTAAHRQVAEDHGFTAIAEVDIQDADGSMTLPVTGGTRLTENYVGANFGNYDSYLVLSHFKPLSITG